LEAQLLCIEMLIKLAFYQNVLKQQAAVVLAKIQRIFCIL